MSKKLRTCHFCGTAVGAKNACPTCVAAFPNRRDATSMTAEERVAELETWLGILETPFDMLHQRVEELVGRPVWTHEMAYPDALIAEIRAGTPASLGDVLAKLPADKPVILAVVEKGEAAP